MSTKPRRASTLLVGMCWLPTEHARMTLEIWTRLQLALNPDCDILVIDSQSPVDPMHAIGNFGFVDRALAASDEIPTGLAPLTLVRFPDNVGHLSRGGLNGAGRALCKGIEIGLANGYSFIANVECDMMLGRSISALLARMNKARVRFAAPFDSDYRFLETGIMLWQAEWLRRSNFVARYSWQTPLPPGVFPEHHAAALGGDDLWYLPLTGLRNDQNRVTTTNYASLFPRGLDYITHVRDIALLHKFMDMNKIAAASGREEKTDAR